VLGDCVICAGIIAYMGAFPITYREETVLEWKKLIAKLNIKSSGKFSLQNVLSDPLTIGIWTDQQQLPNDDFSIDNAIIMKNSSRWPLMIDPQIQANNWIKIMEKDSSMIILRQTKSAKEIEMKLENAIQVGIPVLLENIT
jgi:dynein heavy chain